jgi:hypothetical protein
MNKPDYILLSPIGEHKKYSVEDFITSIHNFEHKPSDIVFCVDLDSSLVSLKERKDLTILFNPEIFIGPSYLERICSAREILRKYFIYGPHTWALWIDSDIIAPPETPDVLLDVAEKEDCLLVCNKYDGRTGHKWSGSGVMLTHKYACTISRFWVGSIEDRNISEDFVFFSIFDQARHVLKMKSGKKNTRVIGEFVETYHWMNE